MIFVDTNVLISLAFEIEGHESAQKLVASNPLLGSSMHWRVEFAHVISRQARLGHISFDAGIHAANALEQIGIEEFPLPSIRDILAVSKSYTCSGQDAIFLYWARELGQPLVTRDMRLVNASKGLAVSLLDYLKSH